MRKQVEADREKGRAKAGKEVKPEGSREVRCMSNSRYAVEEHSVGAEAIPRGVVDRTEERMLA